ncbi:MAG: hypothetical protein M1839_009204 [Geoglossum umbratile]|nr:MAG: hypothetical protein M1839_009204 [Geoglossum umbratile]
MSAEVANYNLLADGFHVSCGVELEFMSRTPKPKENTEHYPYKFVTQLLNEGSPNLRFKFNDLSGTEEFDYEGSWTITLDETLEPDLPAAPGQLDSVVTGMELISPVLSFDHGRWPHRDLEHICGLLNATKTRDCHFWSNKSCGLHVHIGVLQDPNPNLKVDNLEFLTIQNLVAVWGVYEKEIEQLHPAYRRAPDNKFAASLRSIAPHRPNYQAASAADWLTLVYACRDFDSLRDLIQNTTGVGDTRDSKINIVAYSRRDTDKVRPNRDPTIEFREHAGSLDPFEVSFWIAFVSKMVLFGVWLAKSNLRFDIEGAQGCAPEDLLDGLNIWGAMRSHYVLKILGESFDDLFAALRRLAARFDNLPLVNARQIAEGFDEAKEGLGSDPQDLLVLSRKVNRGLGLNDPSDSAVGFRLFYYEQLYECSPEVMGFAHNGMLMAWATQEQGAFSELLSLGLF